MVGKQLKQFLDISDSQKIGFSVFVSSLEGRWEWRGDAARWGALEALRLPAQGGALLGNFLPVHRKQQPFSHTLLLC